MEDKANEQNQPVAGKPVTDADLDSALNPKQDEVTDVGQPKEIPPHDAGIPLEDEHSERSRLGRQVKKLKEQVDMLLSATQREREPAPSFTPPPAEDMPEFISTPEDVEKVLIAREKRSIHMRNAYTNAYVKQLERLGEVNNELHEEVLKEMSENPNFNSMETKNPYIDARINYAEAKAAILAKKSALPVHNVSSDRAGSFVPSGVSVTNRNQVIKTGDTIKLTPEAEEFRREMGMTDEEVRAALTGPSRMIKQGRFGS